LVAGLKKTGVDSLDIGGVGGTFVLNIAAELGFDLHQFPSTKHFTSWLGLSPNKKYRVARYCRQEPLKNKTFLPKRLDKRLMPSVIVRSIP
jgi:Transposase IS116/IS110/IS902 family